MTPLQQKIVDLLNSQPGRTMSYHAALEALWPQDKHPKAWRYSSNGGPPGCAMVFGRAFGQLRKAGLVFEEFKKAGRGNIKLLRQPE